MSSRRKQLSIKLKFLLLEYADWYRVLNFINVMHNMLLMHNMLSITCRDTWNELLSLSSWWRGIFIAYLTCSENRGSWISYLVGSTRGIGPSFCRIRFYVNSPRSHQRPRRIKSRRNEVSSHKWLHFNK